MLWMKVFFLLLALLLLVVLVRATVAAWRYQRRFGDTSTETDDRLQHHLSAASLPQEQPWPVRTAVPEPTGRDEILALEEELLRALCSDGIEGRQREEALNSLRNHDFQDVLHHQAYDALRALPTHSPETLREQLPARLTQQGFPDVEFERFLRPRQGGAASVEELIERLGAASRMPENRRGG
jgi:hypothetical protein